MNIHVIAVGNLKEPYLKEAQKEYSKRLSRFCGLNVIEVGEDISISKEADNIKRALPKNTHIIALAIEGRKYNSIEFSNHIKKLMVDGKSSLTLIIGGSTGLDESILCEADSLFSMSDLTFPHQLARVILLEQVYRAFKILHGETYHK